MSSHNVDDLPPFVCYRIAAHLTLEELGVLCRTSLRWSRLMRDEACWKVRCALRYRGLLCQFVTGWPGGEKPLYKHVAVLLRLYMDAFPDECRARIVLAQTDLEMHHVFCFHHRIVIRDDDACIRGLGLPCILLAATWDQDKQWRNYDARSIWASRIPVSVMLLVPERICRDIPQFMCPRPPHGSWLWLKMWCTPTWCCTHDPRQLDTCQEHQYSKNGLELQITRVRGGIGILPHNVGVSHVEIA